ncbi:SAF domain-containing protein [Planomonospora corallina]|uniref:SAF domain-containing protein n=1 Tax=Planomonospora corallina TaxID=1806052 RepID=A0ABV8ID13_9ACTN
MVTTAVRPARPTTGAPKKRRSTARVLLGAVLVAACALASAAITLRTGSETGAVAVRSDLPAGHVLTTDDLRTVPGSVEAGLIPASRAQSLVGRKLAVPVVAGALLTEKNVGAAAYPRPDQALIGAAVRPGQYTPGLAPGDRVVVAEIPGDTVTASTRTRQQPVIAVVTDVRRPEQPQSPAVVTLLLARADAEKVAVPVAQGLFSLVQIAPEAR